MSQFREMEWNAKWDWENFGGYGSKAVAIESGKKGQLADWGIADDGDIIHGGGNSGSDAGHGGSISASTDSGIHTIEGSFSNKMDSSAEASLGLKLGKRTYFENSGGGGGGGVMPTTRVKKTKSCGQNALPVCCQVEGCNIDLSKAKEYHRKHRVCDSHSKCSRVIVAGLERRFCQQCSRFHGLSEFDEKKRSCRKRLSDHNARRRKPPQETIQFDPSRQATPYYGGKQEMSCVLSNSALGNSNSKFTLTQGYSCFKSNGGDDQLLHIPAAPKPQAIVNMQTPLKDSTSNPGSKGGLISCAPEFGRALSLLSTDSCEQESVPSRHQMHVSNSSMIHANAIPQGDFWLQHSTQPHIPSNPNFHDIHLFKTPYDAAVAANFYSNILN